MNLTIKEPTKREQIIELHNGIQGSLRRTVEDAVRIGELLTAVKDELPHGDFMLWVQVEMPFQRTVADNYIRLFRFADKLPRCGNLQEAYRQIETLERQEKQTQEKQDQALINEREETGEKPEGWNRSLDYKFQKHQKNEEIKERIDKVFEEANRTIEEKKEHKRLLDEGLKKLVEREEQKDHFRQKIRMSGDNAREPFFDVLDEYLSTLPSSTQMEACHNLIKYCKGIVSRLQMESL